MLGGGCVSCFTLEQGRHGLQRLTCGRACPQGAFSVAAKAKVPVVPVTLIGTGALMPNGQESHMYSGSVRMVVHPPIPPSTPDAMMEATRREIASCLPPAMVA